MDNVYKNYKPKLPNYVHSSFQSIFYQ